jgi:hypothetical protein
MKPVKAKNEIFNLINNLIRGDHHGVAFEILADADTLHFRQMTMYVGKT